jgi:hypothetical protein
MQFTGKFSVQYRKIISLALSKSVGTSAARRSHQAIACLRFQNGRSTSGTMFVISTRSKRTNNHFGIKHSAKEWSSPGMATTAHAAPSPGFGGGPDAPSATLATLPNGEQRSSFDLLLQEKLPK